MDSSVTTPVKLSTVCVHCNWNSLSWHFIHTDSAILLPTAQKLSSVISTTDYILCIFPVVVTVLLYWLLWTSLKKSVIVLVLTTGSNVYWAYIMSMVLSGRSSADVPLTCVCQRSCLTFKCRCTLLSSSHLLHMVVLPSSFLCIFLQLIPIDQSRRYELLSLAIYTVFRKKGYILF